MSLRLLSIITISIKLQNSKSYGIVHKKAERAKPTTTKKETTTIPWNQNWEHTSPTGH